MVASSNGVTHLRLVPEVVIITHLLCHIVLLSVGVPIGGEEGGAGLYLRERLLVGGSAEYCVWLLPLGTALGGVAV